MPSLISFGEINKNILYPIFGGLSKLIAELILYESNAQINKHPIILGLATGLGMFLSLIPYFILKKRSKSKNKNKNKIIGKKSLIYNDPDYVYNKKKRYIKYSLILLSSVLDYFQKILSFLFTGNVNNNIWIFNILFLSLFSYLILKEKLYSYHYLSLIIIIVLGIIINIINLYDVKLKDIKYELLSIFIEIIYSLVAVINKYVMEVSITSPYELSFYEGSFSLVINIILLIICTKYEVEIKFIPNEKIIYKDKKYLDNFFAYYNKLNVSECIIFFIFVLSRLLFNLFGLITINNYTASHIVILLIIGEIGFFFKNEKTWELIIEIIIIIILFFMILVFTEIIELNFWGLQKNTKKNIAIRALEEEILNLYDDDNIKEQNEEFEMNFLSNK